MTEVADGTWTPTPKSEQTLRAEAMKMAQDAAKGFSPPKTMTQILADAEEAYQFLKGQQQ